MGDLLKPTETNSIFDGMEIRKTWEYERRFFSITDTIIVLVGTKRPKQYRTDLKTQLKTEGNELYGKIVQLKLKAADGKNYLTDCVDTETMLRIIQSIPSPKAEPFKQRLAGVGNEMVQEINDPELGIHRAKARAVQLYKARGFTDKEIVSRMSGIETRFDFTKELNNRGIESGKGFAILTNIASYGWAEKTAAEYRKFKGLTGNDNLRDHMTRQEHLLTAIAEEATTEIMKNNDLQGFQAIQGAAVAGSNVAKNAKNEFEDVTGSKVTSSKNRLTDQQKKRRGLPLE